MIGEYTTDKNGMIQIDELQPGWYTAVEVKSPDGYLLNDTIKDFEIKTGKTVTVEFPNQKLTSLIIKKTDEKSGEPLSGAKFYVEKQNGEHVGEYTTDKDGTINIATLSPDWYVIREKLSPDGYLLDETPKTVEVKTNVPTVVTFTNKKHIIEIGRALPVTVLPSSFKKATAIFLRDGRLLFYLHNGIQYNN